MSNINEETIRRRLELLAAVEPSAAATGRAMERVRHSLQETPQRQQARTPGIWRILMESKWSRLAVAGAVILAVAFGLNIIGGRHMGGVAWSQMVEKVQQIRSCVHRTQMILSRDNQPDTVYEFVMYRSSDYGIRRDAYLQGKLVSQLYVARDVEQCVEVVPSEKKYVKTKFSEAQLVEMRQKSDPRELLTLFTGFDHTGLGTRMIEGKMCEGIEVSDPRFGLMLFEEGTGRIWADPARDLPVLMEFEGTSAGGTVRTRLVVDQFDWDAPLTASDFEPNIPADYTVMAEVDLSASEQSVVKGLARFAKITAGRYPTSLDVITAMREVQSAFIVARRRQGIAVEEPPTKAELGDILAIQGVCMYYGNAATEDKEVAYYGATVTSEFPHAVLMRWRTEEGAYRVILGDLSTRDVTAEGLADLEAQPLNPQTHAIKPEPADGIVGTPVDGLHLAWLSGAGAVEHRVYLGTDPDALPLLGTVTESPFTALPTLERDTTYYWHVDEVAGDGSVTPGNLWTFGTGRLVGWWKLDETDGVAAADASGNGHAGQLVGDPNWTVGTIGGALAFDGDGDYVDLGTAPDFDMTEQVTITTWIKVRAFDVDWQAIVTKGDTAWRLSGDQGNKLHFGCTGIWPEWVRGHVDVNDGQWHHVAGVYDGSALYLYIDGVLDVSARATGPINVNTYAVAIGGNAEKADREWNGVLDDVRLYNYALSVAEIQALCDGQP